VQDDQQGEQEERSDTSAQRVFTPPAQRYFDEERELGTFVILALQLEQAQDKLGDMADAIEALRQGELSSEDTVAAVRAAKPFLAILKYSPLVAQMQLTRSADNFVSYISELLTLIFRTKPETLRSDESMMKLSDILRYGSMDELVSAIAEHRVNELAYMGLRDLTTFLAKRIGFELFPDRDRMATAVKFIELRNLIVHNRGVVNRLFASKLPEYAPYLGTPLRVSMVQVAQHQSFLLAAVTDIDERASNKFGLPVTAY
jgi:hypothetical protein